MVSQCLTLSLTRDVPDKVTDVGVRILRTILSQKGHIHGL